MQRVKNKGAERIKFIALQIMESSKINTKSVMRFIFLGWNVLRMQVVCTMREFYSGRRRAEVEPA
jgi:hypothetical protein